MAEDGGLLSEIDDSLRAERLQELWARYSGAILAFCLLAVLASAGSVWWKNHARGVNEQQTALLAEADAVAQSGKDEEAAALFDTIEQRGGSLAALAGLRHAELLIHLKQEDKALALYSNIASGAKDNAPLALRNFAALQAAILTYNQAKGSEAPVSVNAADAGIFKNSLAELNALRAIKAGDAKAAAPLLNGIVSDANAALSQRARALELLESIKEPKK